MKQVIQDLQTGETVVLEVPVPKPGPRMALVRTAVSMVSAGTERSLVEFAGGSLLSRARSRPDLVRQAIEKVRKDGLLTAWEAVQARLSQPMPLGYASAGTIVEVGEDLMGFRVGDRVACAGGGYAVHAEYAIVPQNLLAHLPESVSFESGAMATLGAIALHGFRLAEPQVGERVAVIGLGMLGLLAVGVAHASGCRVFGIDLDPTRVEFARRMGVEAVVRSGAQEAAAGFSQGVGFDVVLICADTPSDDPVELAGMIARDRARVIAIGAVGMNLPRRVYYDKEITFLVSRSYGPGRYDPVYEEAGQDYPVGYVRWTEGRNLAAFIDLLADRRLDVHPLITHRVPIDRASEAYQLITGKSGEAYLGVVLTYPEADDRPKVEKRVVFLREDGSVPAESVRLGVLGAGNFATTVLLPALKKVKGISFIGIVTATGVKSAHVGRQYGFQYATTDEGEILADDRINTIAVFTRHHLHAQQVIDALQAGKHVFCEKPLTITRDELAKVAKALAASDRLLMVGFNRRFAPLALHLKEFLADLREPMMMQYRINAGHLAPDHWLHDPAQGGGRIIGEACHFIDFLTFLVGDPPQSVRCQGLPDSDRYQEDNVVISLEFPTGSVGTIAYMASGDPAFPKERLEVFGGGRVAVLEDFRRLETSAGGRRRSRRLWLRQDKGYRAEWQAFRSAVAAGGPPPIPYQHLFEVSETCFAAVESLRHDGRPQSIHSPLN